MITLVNLRRRPVGVPPMPAMHHPVAEGVQGFPFARVPVDSVRRWLACGEPLGADPSSPDRPPALTALLDNLTAHGFPCTDEVPGLHESVRLLLRAGADPALSARVETASGPSEGVFPPIAHAAFLGDAGLVAMLAEAGGLPPLPCDHLMAALCTLRACADQAYPSNVRSQQIVAGIRSVLHTLMEFRPAFELSDREAAEAVRLSIRISAHPHAGVPDEVPSIIERMPGSPFACAGCLSTVASLVEDAAPRSNDPTQSSPAMASLMPGWVSALCARAAADPETAAAWLEQVSAEGRPESFVKVSIDVAVQAGRRARSLSQEPRQPGRRPRA